MDPRSSFASRPSAHGQKILPDDEWPRLRARLKLSERELSIARAVFDGLKELAIAQQLCMSPHTVHTHLERMYRKLRVHGRDRLILCIVDDYLRHRPASAGSPPHTPRITSAES
jgi:DNA-binding NarL/FixJ family response regulator